MSASGCLYLRIRFRSVLVCLVVLMVAFVIWRRCRAAAVNAQMVDDFEMVVAVEAFARCYGRMPSAFGELVEKGYIRAVQEGPRRGYRVCLPEDPSVPPISAKRLMVLDHLVQNPFRLQFAWGVTPEQLVLRGGRVYWRDQAEKEAILCWPKAFSGGIGDRERNRTLYLYMAMLEGAKRRASQSVPASRATDRQSRKPF